MRFLTTCPNMNLFSDLKVTSTIPVSVRYRGDLAAGKVFINDQDTLDIQVSISEDIVIRPIDVWIDHVAVDGIDITDHVYDQLASNNIIQIPGPFYHWWHQVSGQGWLLWPHHPG